MPIHTDIASKSKVRQTFRLFSRSHFLPSAAPCDSCRFWPAETFRRAASQHGGLFRDAPFATFQRPSLLRQYRECPANQRTTSMHSQYGTLDTRIPRGGQSLRGLPSVRAFMYAQRALRRLGGMRGPAVDSIVQATSIQRSHARRRGHYFRGGSPAMSRIVGWVLAIE